MANEGCIIYPSSGFSFVDDVTVNVDFNSEINLGSHSYDFFDAGTNNEALLVPTGFSGNAQVWGYMETSNISGDDAYWGIISNNQQFTYLIQRDAGHMTRGQTTGVIDVDDTWYFVNRTRTFGNNHPTANSRTHLGILLDPQPIAAACGYKTNFEANGNTYMTGSTEEFDFGGVFDPSSGEFTAPSGAHSVALYANGWSDLNGNDNAMKWFKNGSEIVRSRYDASARAPMVASFGLWSCTSGDTIEFVADRNASGINMYDVRFSAIFYG